MTVVGFVSRNKKTGIVPSYMINLLHAKQLNSGLWLPSSRWYWWSDYCNVIIILNLSYEVNPL